MSLSDFRNQMQAIAAQEAQLQAEKRQLENTHRAVKELAKGVKVHVVASNTAGQAVVHARLEIADNKDVTRLDPDLLIRIGAAFQQVKEYRLGQREFPTLEDI